MKITQIQRLFFGKKERAKLWKKLASLLRHNVSIVLALTYLCDEAQRQRKLYAGILHAVLTSIAKGSSVANAFSPYVSHTECMLIQSGECADIGKSFEEAQRYLKDTIGLEKRLLGAIAYPLFLCVLLFGILWMLSSILLPTIVSLVPLEELQGSSKILYEGATFFTSKSGFMFFLACVFSLFLILFSCSRWRGYLRRIADRVFPWNLYRMRVGAAFLVHFSKALSLGTKPRVFLQDCLTQSSITPYLAERVLVFQQQMAKGKNIGAAIQNSGFQFPTKEIANDLLFYANIPNFEEEFVDIAQEFQQEVEEKIQTTLHRLGIALLVAVALVIAFFLQGIFELEMQIAKQVF